MKTSRRILAGLVVSLVIIVAVVSTAAAHETWLQPDNFFVQTMTSRTVRMTSGMGEHYPTADSPIEPSRIIRM